MNKQIELATFGAGCFWGVEARFRAVEGVLEATSGYMGGQPEPDYRAVCTGTTGHAEVVQLQFDPQLVSFESLLDLFFDMHNPTTLNRQGPDFGSQYRSAIFTVDDAQREAARKKIVELDAAGTWRDPLVTEVNDGGVFWPAEEYHQRYFEKNGGGYCKA